MTVLSDQSRIFPAREPAKPVYNRSLPAMAALLRGEDIKARSTMNPRGRFLVGVLTALAMMLLTFALPRGGPLRDALVVQFPMTVGIWAIFVLLFVKLK